jgi:CMP-N-acetylneuraminic acid synthetase
MDHTTTKILNNYTKNNNPLNIALVLLRGGSISIPKKNIVPLGGRPLCDWIIKSCTHSKIFDEIWVSTDCNEIADVASKCGALIHMRDPKTATNDATSSSAVLDFLHMRMQGGDNLGTIAICQATSPFTTPEILQGAYRNYFEKKANSVVSAVRMHIFRWSGKDDYYVPTNYICSNRPRRQDWNGELCEDGAFYIMNVCAFLLDKNIVPEGKVILYEMPHGVIYDINTMEDYTMIKLLAEEGMGFVPEDAYYLNKK